MIRRCLDCPRRISSGSRCTDCTRARARDRQRTRSQPWYGGDWRKVSLEARTAHVRAYGLVCPGYGVPRHRVAKFRDLTLDHVEARSRAGGLVVLCRSCNARKGGDRG